MVGVNATIPAGDVLLAVGPGLVAECLRMTAGETGALMGARTVGVSFGGGSPEQNKLSVFAWLRSDCRCIAAVSPASFDER